MKVKGLKVYMFTIMVKGQRLMDVLFHASCRYTCTCRQYVSLFYSKDVLCYIKQQVLHVFLSVCEVYIFVIAMHVIYYLNFNLWLKKYLDMLLYSKCKDCSGLQMNDRDNFLYTTHTGFLILCRPTFNFEVLCSNPIVCQWLAPLSSKYCVQNGTSNGKLDQKKQMNVWLIYQGAFWRWNIEFENNLKSFFYI